VLAVPVTGEPAPAKGGAAGGGGCHFFTFDSAAAGSKLVERIFHLGQHSQRLLG
jgi:hypothetical protein